MIAAPQATATGYAIETGVTGRIKWYDPNRGQGYIVPDDGAADVMFGGTNVAMPFAHALVQGAPVIFDRYKTPKGYRGLRVRLYAPSCCPTCGRPMIGDGK